MVTSQAVIDKMNTMTLIVITDEVSSNIPNAEQEKIPTGSQEEVPADSHETETISIQAEVTVETNQE
jgi:hypothetical protein